MAALHLPSTIRAWQYTSAHGGIEKALAINNLAPIPKPKPNQHLVRVIAVALNPVDYKPAEIPYIGRLLVPKRATPCIDFAGQLITPASGSSLQAGELVFGAGGSNPCAGGALSEYALADIKSTAKIPEGMDPVEAATVAVAGITAYQSIVPYVKEGSKVFINGGSGGTGVFGIQMAKAVGCHVTTSCSTANVEFCESLGADKVVDYKKEDVIEALVKSGTKFDHVVDNVGSDPQIYWRCHEFTNSDAKLLMVGGSATWSAVGEAVKRKVWSGKRTLVGFWPKHNVEHLDQIGMWMKEGKVKAVLDTKFEFEDARKAFEKLKTGRARGKIVIDVASKTYKTW